MAGLKTIESGTLQVGAVLPNPPFEFEQDGVATGFDAELMRAVCGQLGLRWRVVRYEGVDFNGIFDGLRTGDYDAVMSGTPITPERERVAQFSEPYLECGQSVMVNTVRSGQVTSAVDLSDEVVGVQTANVSEAAILDLSANGESRDIRAYPTGSVVDALDDLEAGRIGAFMTLTPVARWLATDRPDLAVVLDLPTQERLGIAFAPGTVALRDAVNRALIECRRRGVLDRLERRWLDAPVT